MIDTYEEETAIIGAICCEPELVRVVERYVEPRHFLSGTCRTVYEYAVETDAAGRVFDALIAADALKEANPEIRRFLAECMEVTPTMANTEEYARILRSKADERELREKVAAALEEESGAKLTEAIAAVCAEQIQARRGGRMKKYSEVLTDTYTALSEKPENRVDTGYGKLDFLLKGMWDDELILIGARPAVGKSAFALSVVEHVAKSTGKVVHLYSLEMPGNQIGERALARHTSFVTMDNLIERNLENDNQWSDVAQSLSVSAGLPILIDDSANVKMSKVRAQALTEKNLGLIVIDYGGLLTPDKKYDSRNLELGAISRDAKNLANELKVPVVMLVQLNRGISDDTKPTLREIRDSGELEQNANKVIFLWNIDRESGRVGASVAKNRRGLLGEVVMQFDGSHMRFYETEDRYEEPKQCGKRSGGFSQDEN